jgi:hypothetical protein
LEKIEEEQSKIDSTKKFAENIKTKQGFAERRSK